MTRVLSALVLLSVRHRHGLVPAARVDARARWIAALLAFVEYAAIAAALGAHVPRVVGGAAVLAACAAAAAVGWCRRSTSCS